MKSFLVFAWLILLSSSVQAQQHSYTPPDGFVPDAPTAVKIAEAVLIPIYGADTIERQRPFSAILKDGTWTVSGSTPKGTFGGNAVVEISKTDGRVERVSHTR